MLSHSHNKEFAIAHAFLFKGTHCRPLKNPLLGYFHKDDAGLGEFRTNFLSEKILIRIMYELATKSGRGEPRAMINELDGEILGFKTSSSLRSFKIGFEACFCDSKTIYLEFQ